MFGHVDQQFTHRPEQRGADRRVERFGRAVVVYGHAQLVDVHDLVGQPVQRGDQAHVVQHGRAELKGHGPHPAVGFVHRRGALVQRLALWCAELQPGHGGGLELDQRNELAQVVVQVLRQGPALALFGQGQRGRQGAHFLGALAQFALVGCGHVAAQVAQGFLCQLAFADVGVGDDDAADLIVVPPVRQHPAQKPLALLVLKLQVNGLELGQHLLGSLHQATAAELGRKVAYGAAHVAADEAKQALRSGGEPLDAERRVQAHRGNVAAGQQVAQVGVGHLQLAHLHLQLLVHRGELFVERLQLFLGTLQLFVERAQFFVDRHHLFVGHGEVFVGHFQALNGVLQVVPGDAQFVFQLAHQRRFGAAVARHQRGLAGVFKHHQKQAPQLAAWGGCHGELHGVKAVAVFHARIQHLHRGFALRGFAQRGPHA